MPAEFPRLSTPLNMPYYRTISFLAGGGATLLVLLLITNLLARVTV